MTKHQVDEYLKCLKDKSRIYFIESYLSTFNAVERKTVPFKLFPRQKVYLNTIVKDNNVVTVKHRQCGITTVSSAWITGQLVFATKSAPETVLCIGNKKDISEQLVEKIGNFLDQVPRWMWGSEYYSPDPDSEKNKKSIYKTRNRGCIELFNGCKVHARSSGENAARGISAVSILIFDEAAFIQNGTTVYAQAVAATASTGGSARILMVSTPNGKDPLYWKTYDNAINKRNNFAYVEFKWFQDLRYNRNLSWHRQNAETGEDEVIYETLINKKGDIEYNEERWRQLEKDGWKPTSPWYITMCKTFNNDSQRIAQELDISFLGSSDTVVPIDVIEQHRVNNMIEITDEWELRDNLVKETWIWKDPVPGHRYICSCLPEGEKILTQDGLKNIEDINLNDLLINKDGKFVKIHKKYIKAVKDETIYKIRLSNTNNFISFTGEHPIWSSVNSVNKRCYSKHNSEHNFNEYYWEHNFKYNKASEIKVNDWVKVPNFYKYHTLTDEEILSHWTYENKNPLLDEDFWWYCGMWLAEGCAVKRKKGYNIYTSHHIKEADIHNKVFNIVRKLEHTPNMRQVGENCVNIFYSFKNLGLFLKENFGQYAHGKFIKEWIKYFPIKYKLQLLLGYFEGDGSFVRNKRDGIYIKSGSVSNVLCDDIQDLLFSIGIVSSVNKLHKSKEYNINGRKCFGKQSYEISIPKYYSKKLFNMWGNPLAEEIIIERNTRHSFCYFNEDETKIYFKINEIIQEKQNNIVYNFETETHSFCGRYIATHNCDPSSGSGDDYSAIQIIDIDAVDEDGIPFFEQVLEYNGRLNGSEIGQIVDRYGRIYNNALVVTECIGGYGDTVVLTLLELNYPNLYYDDSNLKNYTNQNIKDKKTKYEEQQKQLPGFRSNALRLQMISNFVEMLKDNSFRIYSQRTISELGTWIFKNGRPDHMDGSHDDLLTCLAMGLFVMQFYMLRKEKEKNKSVAMINSWRVNNLNTVSSKEDVQKQKEINISKNTNYRMNPFIDNEQKREKNIMIACLMMGGFKI